MNSQTIYGWLARGLHGVLNMLEMAAKECDAPTPNWVEDFNKAKERLNELSRQIEDKATQG